jgi:hypothetical protein
VSLKSDADSFARAHPPNRFVEKFVSAFDNYITASEACHVAAGDRLFLIAVGSRGILTKASPDQLSIDAC